jgi:uncharacterized protein
MSGEVWYLDTSALVKTVIVEAGSGPLDEWLRDGWPCAACELIRVEAVRAVRLADPAAVPRVRHAIATLTLIRLDDALFTAASELDPPPLRSLDAIHLAAALSLGSDLAGLITYDRRMTEGARALGLRVEAPR